MGVDTITANLNSQQKLLREGFGAVRLSMSRVIHGLAQLRKLRVNELSGAVLVSERTMRGRCVPWVIGKNIGEGELFRRIESLLWNINFSDGNERRQALRPFDGCVFDRHAAWICLRLNHKVQFYILACQAHGQ